MPFSSRGVTEQTIRYRSGEVYIVYLYTTDSSDNIIIIILCMRVFRIYIYILECIEETTTARVHIDNIHIYIYIVEHNIICATSLYCYTICGHKCHTLLARPRTYLHTGVYFYNVAYLPWEIYLYSISYNIIKRFTVYGYRRRRPCTIVDGVYDRWF